VEDINTVYLLVAFLGVWLLDYFLAWLGRNDYDFSKIARLYGVIGGIFCLLSSFFLVNWVLAIGLFLFGFVVLVFRNQHYFDSSKE
jgi:hypothetical protein